MSRVNKLVQYLPENEAESDDEPVSIPLGVLRDALHDYEVDLGEARSWNDQPQPETNYEGEIQARMDWLLGKTPVSPDPNAELGKDHAAYLLGDLLRRVRREREMTRYVQTLGTRLLNQAEIWARESGQ